MSYDWGYEYDRYRDDPYYTHDVYDDYDEPVRRVTDLGGGYQLIEEDGLCVIEPDPMLERMEYEAELHAEDEAEREAEYLEFLESQQPRDLDGNEVLMAGDREW